MRAAFIRRHGGNEVVEVGERPAPRLGPQQVLIRVHAACVNPRDWLLRDGRYVFRHLVRGFPIILGSDVSGEVVETGPLARRFRPGEEVYAMQTHLGQMGAYAELMAVHEKAVAHKPANMTHEEAAGVPVAGLTALQALRDEGALRPGERVLVLGASGGVGHYAVQLAKHMGAKVVAVCSAPNHPLAKELGADEVIDYRTEEVPKEAGPTDLVLDAIGKGSMEQYRSCMRPGARYVSTVPTGTNARDFLRSHASKLFAREALVSKTILVRAKGSDLAELAHISERGGVRTVIDSVFPLDRVKDALARSRSQRARGKIILRVRQD
jgi:NADPH:quinone reductase-like Zn-dependent oxidoreductase